MLKKLSACKPILIRFPITITVTEVRKIHINNKWGYYNCKKIIYGEFYVQRQDNNPGDYYTFQSEFELSL